MEDALSRRRASLTPAALALCVLAMAPDSWGAVREVGGLNGKEEVVWSRLRTRIEGIERGLDGVLGISVRDLKSSATIEIRPDETFPLASSIKLAILYELYRQAEEGRIDLGEATRPGLPRVGGDGVLYLLSDRMSLTWRDLAVLMMSLSDNEATNVLIDRVSLAAVNRRLDELGLPTVRLRRRMMDLDAARRGDENVGTPSQLRRLAEIVYEGRGLTPPRAGDLRTVAALPKSSPFRAPIPESLTVMDKPGSLDAVRCVTAVVELPGRPYAVSIGTTFLRRDADGEAAIREISAALFETFDRLARSSEYGRTVR